MQQCCSGGPSEISKLLHSKATMDSHVESVENMGMYEDLGEHLSNHSEQGSNNKGMSDDEETIPKGTSYPLYSKRLRIKCLRQIAGAMGVAIDVSAAQTRMSLEKKLVEMNWQPTCRCASHRSRYQ